MSVTESLQKYLEARYSGADTDDLRKALVNEAEQLVTTLKTARQQFDLEWYVNQRFIDGDHFLKFDRKSGKVTNAEPGDDEGGKKIRRSINLMKAQIRGLKNFVLKAPLTVEFSPAPKDGSEEAKEAARKEARNKEAAWRGIEDKLKLKRLRRPVVDDGFVKHSGYIGVLPASGELGVRVDRYDSYDVYPDSTASFYDGTVLLLATKQNVQAIKSNSAYENTAEVKGDGRLSLSDFKNNYERSKLGGANQNSQGDLESTILRQLFIKCPYGEEVGEDGTKKLKKLEDGQVHIWIITFTTEELHRIEETRFKQWPLIRYTPEDSGGRVHGRAWAHDLKDPNKTVNNMISTAEEWHVKAKPKLLVPKDSSLKEITTTTAEVLEYDARKSDGIKDFMPQGVPASLFTLVNLSQAFSADVGGMHRASGGDVPVGVKSGRGIEALQSADAEFNMAEPMENWAETWQEMVERVLEVVSEQVTTQVPLEYEDSEGMTQRLNIMGKAGLQNQDGSTNEAPEGVVVITPSRVKVRAVPEVSYTEDGRREILKELYESKLIDRKTVLEAYRFGNVGDIIDRVLEEQEQASQTPPPKQPIPADKLINALANLRKSGEPILPEQIDVVLTEAGVPTMAELSTPAAPIDTPIQ